MTTRLKDGAYSWRGGRDDKGIRTYEVTHRIICDSRDGPANALQTPGLPQVGNIWAFDDDVDIYAWCLPNTTITPYIEDGDPNTQFLVTQTFSTRPFIRCLDVPIEDPILEPDRVSGGGIRKVIEAAYDRFDQPILSSSWEAIRGPIVSFDDNDHVVRIEQNRADLEMDLWRPMINRVNDTTLWGNPPRTVKLSNVQWDLKYYAACFCYYVRMFEFEINDEGFDRDARDEGTKVLHGEWEIDATGKHTGAWKELLINGMLPDQNNPTHFDTFLDKNGSPSRVILDGRGRPADTHVVEYTGTGSTDTDPGEVHIEYYKEANFQLLGLPVELDDCTLQGGSTILRGLSNF